MSDKPFYPSELPFECPFCKCEGEFFGFFVCGSTPNFQSAECKEGIIKKAKDNSKRANSCSGWENIASDLVQGLQDTYRGDKESVTKLLELYNLFKRVIFNKNTEIGLLKAALRQAVKMAKISTVPSKGIKYSGNYFDYKEDYQELYDFLAEEEIIKLLEKKIGGQN